MLLGFLAASEIVVDTFPIGILIFVGSDVLAWEDEDIVFDSGIKCVISSVSVGILVCMYAEVLNGVLVALVLSVLKGVSTGVNT